MNKEEEERLKEEFVGKIVGYASGTISYVDVENWFFEVIDNTKSQLSKRIDDLTGCEMEQLLDYFMNKSDVITKQFLKQKLKLLEE